LRGKQCEYVKKNKQKILTADLSDKNLNKIKITKNPLEFQKFPSLDKI
jgi:hypothetical protein